MDALTWVYRGMRVNWPILVLAAVIGWTAWTATIWMIEWRQQDQKRHRDVLHNHTLILGKQEQVRAVQVETLRRLKRYPMAGEYKAP